MRKARKRKKAPIARIGPKFEDGGGGSCSSGSSISISSAEGDAKRTLFAGGAGSKSGIGTTLDMLIELNLCSRFTPKLMLLRAIDFSGSGCGDSEGSVRCCSFSSECSWGDSLRSGSSLVAR